jgi:hypothetical protein
MIRGLATALASISSRQLLKQRVESERILLSPKVIYQNEKRN